ncbi:MAG: hypothetical protein WBV82_13815 [Myxococcaceae bacterium]
MNRKSRFPVMWLANRNVLVGATLEMQLAAPDKRLLASEGELFLRAPPMPMPARESLPGMMIEVAERDDAVPLEDPSIVFLHWNEGELERLVPPAVGAQWTEKEPPLL